MSCTKECHRDCPNCKQMCKIDEYNNHCPKCGFIFIDMIKRMSEEETGARGHTRRTGAGVDLIDG